MAFPQVHFERAIGDEFDIVEAKQAPVRTVNSAIAGSVDIDDRRAFFAQGFPDNAAPAGLEGALDIIGLVRGWSRGEPERVRRFDAEEIR
jgi:hypothetical protein